tara:strand:- start:3551 stop:4171 length:621 start_codon:yes stop_codon:yes gene_type:complete
MKISKKELEQIIKEEIEATLTEEFGDDSSFRMRDMIPPTVRGKAKDTFSKIPNPEREKYGAKRRPTSREKDAWKAAGGELSIFDKEAIAKFLEDAGIGISLEDYVDNIKYAVKGDRLGRRIYSLVDALALANPTGSRRGHSKTAKKKAHKAPQFTRESIEQKLVKEGYYSKGKCVYKKEDDSKVGCTDGPVKDYLAALYANVEDAK